MVIRSWDGTTRPGCSEEYLTFLAEVMVPRIVALPGCLGVDVLQRGEHHFVVQSRWVDEAAIRSFAGSDPEHAVVPEAARLLLSEFDERARHFTVRLSVAPETDGL